MKGNQKDAFLSKKYLLIIIAITEGHITTVQKNLYYQKKVWVNSLTKEVGLLMHIYL